MKKVLCTFIKPKTLEGTFPVASIMRDFEFGWFFQRGPFGLWIRIGWLNLRWGCA